MQHSLKIVNNWKQIQHNIKPEIQIYQRVNAALIASSALWVQVDKQLAKLQSWKEEQRKAQQQLSDAVNHVGVREDDLERRRLQVERLEAEANVRRTCH